MPCRLTSARTTTRSHKIYLGGFVDGMGDAHHLAEPDVEGKNPHIKFGKIGGFTLATPKQEESDAEPLQHFFPERSYVPLLEILSTVNRYTHYVDELQHWQQRYHHRSPSDRKFLLVIR
jgi:hypothetical protein